MQARMLGGLAGRAAWLAQYYAVLLPLAMSTVAVVDSGRRLPPVYWNSSNPIFYTSNTQNVIDVNMWDTLEIVCPHYNDSTHISNWEYYVIYMVNKTEFETCIINNTSQVKIILNCSKPLQKNIYSMPIWPYQGVPGNPDFKYGGSYYFITTSGGTLHEMSNQFHGACQSHNMKLVLNVCCSSDSNPTRPTDKPDVVTERPDQVPTTFLRTTRPTTTTPLPTTTTTLKTTLITTLRSTEGQAEGGKEILDDRTIHAGGREKNTGMISDSGGGSVVTSGCLLLTALLGTLLVTSMCR